LCLLLLNPLPSDTTQNTLDFIGKVGNGLEATVKYVDNKTGNVISAQWNELDKDTQNQIKGGGNILSLPLFSNLLSFFPDL
jgi:hypothetical protein